jgi:diacylglycerol kinase (ATP)
MDHSRIALLVNLKAGKGKSAKVFKELCFHLSGKQFRYDPYSGAWPQTLTGYSHVFLVGGDGTLNYFINKYKDIPVPVAIFKGGSGNDFAWKLYGNKTVYSYLEHICSGIPQKIDAGICNGRYFINGVGIGFDGAVVKAMTGRKGISSGHLRYLLTVIKTVVGYKEQELRLCFNDKQVNQKLFMITVANGSRYGGGFLVAPQALLNDGLLDLVSITCISKLKRLFYLPLVEKGRHLQLPFVSAAKTIRVKIESPSPVAAHLDGELLESTVFDIELMAGKYLFFC